MCFEGHIFWSEKLLTYIILQVIIDLLPIPDFVCQSHYLLCTPGYLYRKKTCYWWGPVTLQFRSPWFRSPFGPLCCFVFIWFSQFFNLVSSWLLSDDLHTQQGLWIGSCLKQEENRQKRKKVKQHFCYMSIIRCIYTHITALYLAACSVWARKNES